MIRSLALAPLVALAALTPLASAHADSPTTGPAPLGTHLRYHHVSWHGTASDPDGNDAGVTVDAPRGWRYTLIPAKQGRFSDPSRTWLMTAQWPEHSGSVRHEERHEIRSLQGTPGLRIERRDVISGLGEVTGVVTYRYTDDGRARWVSYEYQAPQGGPTDKIVSVAGRPQDARGLMVLRDRVVATMAEAG